MASSYNQLVTEIQSSLFAFIFSLIGDPEAANDILQETNLVLWEKESDYDPSRPFHPWAYKISYLQVLAYRKRVRSDRLLFDDDLVDRVAGGFEVDNHVSDRRDALAKCLKRLESRATRLVQLRYHQELSLTAIAEQCEMSLSSVKVALFRARKVLADCIERKLIGEEGPA